MKKLLLPFLLVVVFVYSCNNNGVGPENTYYWELIEFNRVSDFNAHLIDDTAVVNHAKSGQGHGSYPGVDNWFSVRIDSGEAVWGGLPGQSQFYSIVATIDSSKGEKVAYWMLLQVKQNPVFGYRKYVGGYRLNKTINAAISKTLANPQYGNGGGWQIFIENFSHDLIKFNEITLKDTSVTFN
ncbi:MAG TPA: hypothetical protein VHP32_05355 [Ignavibacteria bacterium]|nr:hypothetical protein [Ignavibacteria bacterium]